MLKKHEGFYSNGVAIQFDAKRDQYEFNGTHQKKFSAKGFMNKVLMGHHIPENQSSKGLAAQMNNPDKLSLQEKQAIEFNGGTIGKDGFGILNK